MIRVNKMDGTSMMLNAEWIQSIESTPDTLITLTNGFKLLVLDPLEAVVAAFYDYKRAQKTPVVLDHSSTEEADL